MDLQSILDRGFGLFIINPLLSLKYYNDTLTLAIGLLPGYNTEPIYIEIESRKVARIYNEVFDYVTGVLTGYCGVMQKDISNL